MSLVATCLGHPRIGSSRELKRALEGYWSKQTSAEELLFTAKTLRARHLTVMQAAGLDHVPSNDFSLYDHMLDMAVAVGAVPERYRGISDRLVRYFAMARGVQDRGVGVDTAALEMTKWFDTNYHYIVPELEPRQSFELDASKLVEELSEARSLGLETRPVLPGPLTFLLLSKLVPGAPATASPLDLFDSLLPVYEALLKTLGEMDVGWVQLDEPCLVLDLEPRARALYERAFRRLSELPRRPKLLLGTYFGALGDNLGLAAASGFEALHVDLVRAPEQLDSVLAALPSGTALSAGVVDGRNVWRADLDAAHAVLRRAVRALGKARVFVAPSCSLLHVPVDLASETRLDSELRGWLAFAAQKLGEIRALADQGEMERPEGPLFEAARVALAGRRSSPRTRNAEVRARIAALKPGMLRRATAFPLRAKVQRERFQLPLLPTTTIGSFPQTSDVRRARASFRAGTLPQADYERFLEAETRNCIERQVALGLDVLVHGEFERNDMVEYFGEKLEGFAFTENGWVQSYGSRCVKPPILFGDVRRPEPMTVRWATFAQAQTERPVKGMLTGPVTILKWSFVRDDQPRSDTCGQIALALRDEVLDLEAAGIGMIQVDEPAIREGLPLRRGDWETYLHWAVDAFRLATSGARDETQIHTHMCYSEFGDILGAVAELDADVLSIETSRSKLELLEDFASFRYPNDVGPGVYDIHSPRVPTSAEMTDLILRAAAVLPAERLWVNPDCGLKTRGWPEVTEALANLVAAARLARENLRRTAR